MDGCPDRKEFRSSRETGNFGETAAARFLYDRGYRILQRNYHCPAGEVDIIAEDHGTICFVEVKTRSQDFLRAPEDAVDAEKQRRMRATARHYLSRYRDVGSVRFDIVSVVLASTDTIELIELRTDVFPWEP
ncbi:MAG: YraN family protein [Candidatus Hydrogenedentota bacterium]|jgi:putative endonuclease|uniref:UPF0102 protein BRCON_2851 n=1 Tax=Sumerlaea chitinivorans TaxID=2250252 RepID=A0A2Z4YB05_SUMC1|nr:hypothetical protein BRCON_2851 [Candidatus Sumerlaea chitinivorans]MCX7963241.1 YraN family protein [Candidatus Sumerlaea chitinivorans]RMH29011.1 MAG: YraN family protein [Candidatus Hydrogenedentota bacterium]GIX44691.1 MAG: UPF0102 protein [Candidatus Sumerlaea sp.]